MRVYIPLNAPKEAALSVRLASGGAVHGGTFSRYSHMYCDVSSVVLMLVPIPPIISAPSLPPKKINLADNAGSKLQTAIWVPVTKRVLFVHAGLCDCPVYIGIGAAVCQ